MKIESRSFQNVVLALSEFWIAQGCVVVPSCGLEIGAGTLHPATALFPLVKNVWKVAYIQECRRPNDVHSIDHPNRLLRYFQYQVLQKPSPDGFRKIFLDSLTFIGFDISSIDLRFVEDNWENPTLGASGLGWEVWINGLEVAQFTYFQKLCGIRLSVIPGEITYGLERLVMLLQKCSSISEILFSSDIKYGDLFSEWERDNSQYKEDVRIEDLTVGLERVRIMLEKSPYLTYPIYERCLRLIHVFNLLEASSSFSPLERVKFINEICLVIKKCASFYIERHEKR